MLCSVGWQPQSQKPDADVNEQKLRIDPIHIEICNKNTV